jgi:hypothetical protein
MPRRWGIVRRKDRCGALMQKAFFRAFLVLAAIWESSAIVRAASLDLPHSISEKGHVAERGSPGESDHESTAPWRARISRRGALYIIQRIQRACRVLADHRGKDPRLDAILDDLHVAVLRPIYRAHPELKEAAPLVFPSPKPVRATPRDISRATAIRLADDITRLQRRMSKLGENDPDQYADKNAAERAMQPFWDATAELSFARQIAFDAYPRLFAKLFDAIPAQLRTQESDANYRKVAPPHGSVRLSNSARALIKSFMQQVRRAQPKADYVASIGWAREQKSKGPGDEDWIDQGSGWVLGSYLRTQVPPDVIDRIQDIEILFTPEDPSSLAGKIIDVKNHKLFVRD